MSASTARPLAWSCRVAACPVNGRRPPERNASPELSQKILQGVGSRRIEGWSEPSGERSRGPAAAAPGSASSAAARASTEPGRAYASEFRNNRYGRDVSRAPRLQAAPYPRLTGSTTSRARGTPAASAAATPSPDALSTTRISAPGEVSATARAARSVSAGVR